MDKAISDSLLSISAMSKASITSCPSLAVGNRKLDYVYAARLLRVCIRGLLLFLFGGMSLKLYQSL